MTLPEKITITEDLNHLPPPYCYRYTIEIKSTDELHIDFDIVYYDREELDPEEIEAEGFSVNDDFRWNGKLPAVWRGEVERQLTNLKEGPAKKGARVKIVQDGKPIERSPGDSKQLEYFTQELIQAVYEASGKQESLLIRAIYNEEGNSDNYAFSISFFNRSAVLTHNGKTKNAIPWQKAQKMLEQLFSYDFDPFAATDKKPGKKGVFVDAGEGYWYEAGNGIKSPDKKDPKEDILKLFRELF